MNFRLKRAVNKKGMLNFTGSIDKGPWKECDDLMSRYLTDTTGEEGYGIFTASKKDCKVVIINGRYKKLFIFGRLELHEAEESFNNIASALMTRITTVRQWVKECAVFAKVEVVEINISDTEKTKME